MKPASSSARDAGETEASHSTARSTSRAVARTVVAAARSGYVLRLGAELVGRAAIVLGAGRERAGERIDHGAGVLIAAPVGHKVSAGDTVLTLLTNTASTFDVARAFAERAITIGETAPRARPILIDICTN